MSAGSLAQSKLYKIAYCPPKLLNGLTTTNTKQRNDEMTGGRRRRIFSRQITPGPGRPSGRTINWSAESAVRQHGRADQVSHTQKAIIDSGLEVVSLADM